MTSSPAPDATVRQLAAIEQLHSRFGANDVEYWLFGGWAVDLHAGRLTRVHSDIDLAVWQRDLDRIAALLESDGWSRTPDDGDGAITYRREDVFLEMAYLARDDDGVIYTPVDGGRGEWPQHAFGDDVAELGGVHARVIGRTALIEEKSAGYGDARANAKDRVDVAVLTGSDD